MTQPTSVADIKAGDEFGLWRVLERSAKQKFRCECMVDRGGCGATRNLSGVYLLKGTVRDCGCWSKIRRVEKTREITNNPEHTSWYGMKTRCTNPRQSAWPKYGGRGIYVCPRWAQSFEAFREDMGARPDDTSIDRIDSNGSYTCGKCDDCIAKGAPANCRWATAAEQSNNVSRNRLLTFNGETMTVTEWTRRIGCSPAAIFGRLDRGWTVEQALGTPMLRHGLKRKWEEAKGAMVTAAPDHHVSLPTKQRNPNPRKPRNPPPSVRLNLATARPLRRHAEALAA